ncbi:fluoride efflux transporter FluC [Microbacterium sp. HMH0099]|uniref:fluoride efflux transporter FluC n=1 Tax=Microbacterium sp. HMH0099 TaxID=3414026 RepID=UPI003BF72C84
MTTWRDVGLVALGGTLGTAARAGLGLVAGDLGPALVPLINVAGAFLIGILFGIGSRMPPTPRSRRTQLFVGTGVLGGFTTYSALAVEAADPALLGWGIATVVLGTGAAWAGLLLGRRGRSAA